MGERDAREPDAVGAGTVDGVALLLGLVRARVLSGGLGGRLGLLGLDRGGFLPSATSTTMPITIVATITATASMALLRPSSFGSCQPDPISTPYSTPVGKPHLAVAPRA